MLETENNNMRLAVRGVFGEHNACAKVWIEHKGHRVSVGTGFTAEERLRFANDPSQIVSLVFRTQSKGLLKRTVQLIQLFRSVNRLR